MIFSISISAQNPSDCLSALEVCDGSDLDISFQNPTGMINESFVSFCEESNTIIAVETNVIWIKYKFSGGGDFIFNIIPDTSTLDIDFLVFKSEFLNCDSLEGIRCMYSGENVGSPDDSLCMGSTGLSFTSTDFLESPGCSMTDDNYLAPLVVETGDIIYLLINVFSGEHNYKIEHGGSAEISCNPVSTLESAFESLISFYPNPVKDKLKIEWNTKSIQADRIRIHSLLGKEHLIDLIESGDEIDISYLPNGTYFVTISDKNGNKITKKIVKI